MLNRQTYCDIQSELWYNGENCIGGIAMAKLAIRTIGDPVLRQPAKAIGKVNKRVQKLAKDMLESMYAADGVGLAGPQVGVGEQIIVVDIGDGPLIVVNPRIVASEGEETDVEGCLSVPERRGYVKRWAFIVVEGVDENGEHVTVKANGLLARVFQHEIDHLNGVLFVDLVESLPKLAEAASEQEAEE